jgi:hypothetical protein
MQSQKQVDHQGFCAHKALQNSISIAAAKQEQLSTDIIHDELQFNQENKVHLV